MVGLLILKTRNFTDIGKMRELFLIADGRWVPDIGNTQKIFYNENRLKNTGNAHIFNPIIGQGK
jgi:hypothetical protein